MSVLIQNKYRPKILSDIIGNKEVITNINNWLESYVDVKNFLKSNGLLKKSSKGRKKKLPNITEDEVEYSKRKGNLLICGSHGCGKSTIISIILNEHGYDSGPEDGIFGEKTRDAVIEFQSAVDTNPDGVADERTQLEMGKVDTGRDMKNSPFK